MAKDLKSLKDEELVVLVRDQDQELYTEIVDRYQDKLTRYATYLIRQKDKAEDVVQEAFIKAFVNLQGFKTKKKFSSWIYRITHNEAINYIKKYNKETSLDQNEYLREIPNDDSPAKEFEKKETKKMLRKCLGKLPIIYREPLALFYLEEKSYNEISDILRIPMGTLSVRMNRGKKIMKNLCQKNNLYEK